MRWPGKNRCAVALSALGLWCAAAICWQENAFAQTRADKLLISRGVVPLSAASQPSRAAMLVSTVADAAKPAISVGTAIWTIVPAPAGQPQGIGVKAEVDIPDLKLRASMILRKNFDASLPASHTIDLRVTFDPGSPIKGVKDMALPLMRRDHPPEVDALAGVRVKISDNYFLIGLNHGDADLARNLKEIAERDWFDFAMQLDDDRIAKLTFEKGAYGNKFVSQALAAWSSPPDANTPALNPNHSSIGPISTASSHTEIATTRAGGTFNVPVLVNEKVALDFMIDSGASDVSIPADVVSTLRRTGTLTDSDFVGKQTFVLADGSKYPSQIFRLHSLRVGDRVVNNVIAHAVGPEGFLLLGQSFLTKFKSWSIDNNRGLLVLDGEPAGPLGSLWPTAHRP